MKSFFSFAALALCLAGAPSSIFGATISGQLNITGSATVSATEINFEPSGASTGTVTVVDVSDGSFAGLVGSNGTIMDLDSTTQPVGVMFSLPDFLTLPGGITFELNLIQAGVYPPTDCASAPAPGQVCTPLLAVGLSPFNLANTATGSTASFSVSGIVSDGSSSAPSSFIGEFTTQFPGRSYQQILATIGAGGTVEAKSFSATFIATPVPEPATMLLFGAGLLGLGFIAERRRRTL